jgi:hypothetical protein
MCPFMARTISSSDGSVFVQKRDGRDDHPARAIAALRVCVEKRLHGMQTAILLEALHGRDLAHADLIDGHRAGARRHAVNQHCASAALSFAAAVLASGQFEIIPQQTQQGAFAIRVHPAVFVIDVKL